MRIVAGKYGSRRIEAPQGMDTRPTQDKIREAVFSSLGGFFDGGRVLDLYAGSGAIGFEALSRGMEEAVFSDVSAAAIAVIKRNAASLKEENIRILKMKALKAVKLLGQEGKGFDLVYLDPPYKKQENETVMQALLAEGLLRPGARVLVESLKEESFPESVGALRRGKEAVYGITKITYYQMPEE